jgi:endo-1,4-beta-D-glucanase Y
MKSIFLLLSAIFSVCALFACADSSPNNKNEEPSSDSNPSSSSVGENNNNRGAHAVLSGNQNTGRIQEMYNTWMDTYYITYEDDEPNFSSQNQHSEAPGTARIRAAYDGKNDGNYTCSEAMGYGMMLASLMGDWERFNKLLAYTKLFRIPGTALMRWDISNFGFPRPSGGSATDADLDILGALLIAYEKTEEQSYLDEALAIGASIYEWEVGANTKLILPARNNETWGGSNGTKIGDENLFNISYFSLPVLKMLAEYDDSRDWNAVLEASIFYMEMVQNAWEGEGGLWPDWSDRNGEPINPNNGSINRLTANDSSHQTYYKEAPRIPWRIAWYYHWYGDQRAKAMLDNAMVFLRSKGANSCEDFKNFYSYYGGRVGAGSGLTNAMTWSSLCALGVGNAENRDWLNSCNERLLQDFPAATLPNYYRNSLQLIYAMFFNGRY